ncbi:hypothetical protein MVEN_01294600 [Mycena venus]|uniref:F-box domain-containing protein n=1 Tax=Mycena venus TaxID=2733690 RepID=A0A8H6XXA4_9AGAR|nr:hypothetical protein MVEN_01294600 [Mycena venus]
MDPVLYDDLVLSPALAAKVRQLSSKSYGDEWSEFLLPFDTLTIFKLSLTSRSIFDTVMEHVRAHTGDSCHMHELAPCDPADKMGPIPVDVFSMILEDLSLLDRWRLAQTARKYRSLHLRQFQASANALLLRFGLCHSEIRFMQSALLVVVSGSAVLHISFPHVHPDNLDFYVPRHRTLWLARFLKTVTTYRQTGQSSGRSVIVPQGGFLDDLDRFAHWPLDQRLFFENR